MNAINTTHFEALQRILSERGGVLHRGSHGDCSERCCVLEAVNLAKHGKATDSPKLAGMPDIRPLNDASWSSGALRTAHVLPVSLALWDCARWSDTRRQAFAERLAIGTVRETLADLLAERGYAELAGRCRAVTTLGEAESAARAAYAYAYAYAAYAAYAAANANANAADAANANAAADAANAARAAANAARAAANAAAADADAAANANAANAAADAALIKACALWVRCAKETAGL